jgi:hypothetical protein
MTKHIAVTIPGGRYGPFAPLLMFARMAAQARDSLVVPISWDSPEDPLELPEERYGSWVCEQVQPVLDGLPPGDRPLLIAKSLGTHAAALAAERRLPAVWLTPLLTLPFVVDALRRASAPCLLVGGTADPFWDGDLARELSPHVLEITGADHGLFVPGPLAASAEILGRVVTAVEQFLDDAVWPTGGAGTS